MGLETTPTMQQFYSSSLRPVTHAATGVALVDSVRRTRDRLKYRFMMSSDQVISPSTAGPSAAGSSGRRADFDLPIVRLDKDLPLPRRAHPTDAGIDLYAAEDVTIVPGARVLVGTGIAIALPVGTVGLIHPRSGSAWKLGLSIVNAPGTIDSDYRGEIKVCLINLDPQTPITLRRGDRIAQLVVQEVSLCQVAEVSDLDELGQTARGAGGYGSTGLTTLPEVEAQGAGDAAVNEQ